MNNVKVDKATLNEWRQAVEQYGAKYIIDSTAEQVVISKYTLIEKESKFDDSTWYLVEFSIKGEKEPFTFPLDSKDEPDGVSSLTVVRKKAKMDFEAGNGTKRKEGYTKWVVIPTV